MSALCLEPCSWVKVSVISGAYCCSRIAWRSQKRNHMCLVWSCYTKSYCCSPLLLCKDERHLTIVGILAATATQSCVVEFPNGRTNDSRKETLKSEANKRPADTD